MNFNMQLSKNGSVTGAGIDPNGPFSIKGQHENFSLITFTKRMEIKNGWTIYYDGEFTNNSTIEGKWDLSGLLGNFKLWVDDNIIIECLQSTPPEVRQIEAPSVKWEGYYISGGKKGLMNLELTIKKDGTIIGKGTDPFGPFTIDGRHNDYKQLSFLKTMQIPNGWSINYNGDFVDADVMEGTFNVGSNIGPFRIWKH